MHSSVVDYVQAAANRLDLPSGAWVLDVGSYDVNGTPRRIFSNQSYIGFDVRPGPGVDVVSTSGDFTRCGPEMDLVLCLETLEHSWRPWRVINQIPLVLKPGGTAIITTRTFDLLGCFPYHAHPADRWRFSVEVVVLMCLDAGLDVRSTDPDPAGHGVFITATRPRLVP